MSEAKLDITGSGAVAQRELDKSTKEVAKLREQIRRMNEDSKKGFNESATAVTGFAGKLSQASAVGNRWTEGLKRMQQQSNLLKTDFSVLQSAMSKTVAIKEPFGPWVQGLERLKTQTDKWQQGMKVLQQQNLAKRPGNFFGVSAEDAAAVTGAMTGLAAQVIGVGAAVATVTRLYSTWHDKVEQIIQSHHDLSMTTVKSLAEAGQLNLGPEVERWMKSVPGVTPAQAIAAFGGVQLSGETLSKQRQFAVSGEIAKLAPTGLDMTRTGGLAADVAEMAGKGTSAQDVADLTVSIKQQLREKVDEFQGRKFQKQIEALKRIKGMSGIDAMAHAVVALQSEYGAEALRSLADKGVKTADQRRMERAVFTPEAIAGVRDKFAQAQIGDEAVGLLADLGKFQRGREALGEQKVAVEEAEVTEQYGPVWGALKRARRTISARAYKKGLAFGASTDVMHGMDYVFGAVAGPAAIGRAEIRQAQNQGLISEQEAAGMLAELREQTAIMRQERTTRPRNIDAHTE